MIRRLLRNGWQMPGKRPEVRRIRQVLEAELDPFQRRIHRRELYAWERRALGQRLDDGTLLVAGAPRGVLVERLSALLRVDIEDQLRRRSAMALEFANFRRAYLHAATSGEREDLVLGFALTLGARPGRLRGDRRALRRWFGYDAVSERYERWLAKVERRIIFALDRLGALAGFIQRQDIDGTAALSLWRRLDLEPLARSLFVYAGNPRVRSAAFRAVSRLLARMPEDARTDMVTDTTLRFVYRTALEQRQDTWLQCAALNFLAVLAPESLDRVIAVRLKQPGEGDDLFVRRCAVRWLGVRRRRDLPPGTTPGGTGVGRADRDRGRGSEPGGAPDGRGNPARGAGGERRAGADGIAGLAQRDCGTRCGAARHGALLRARRAA